MQTVRLAWHHLIFDVPATWEVFRYRNHYPDGGLGLRDRYGEVMQVFWRLVRTRPAVTSRLVEMVAELGGRQLEPARIRRMITHRHGWALFIPEDPRAPALAARRQKHGPAPGPADDATVIRRRYGDHVLLYVVFPPRPWEDRRLIEDVLATYRSNYGEERVWAAFGLDITLPCELDLARLEPLPTSQVMRFENRRGESVTLQRFPLYPACLGKDTLRTFAARVKGRRYRLYDEGDFTRADGRTGAVLSYRTRGRGGLGALTAAEWQGRLWVWGCEDLHRLYCLDHHARDVGTLPDLPDRVVCCRAAPAETHAGPRPVIGEDPERRSSDDGLDQQLRSVPVVNRAITTAPLSEGRLKLTAPVQRKWWAAPATRLLRFSGVRALELDPVGADLFRLFDGERPLEEIIDHHMERWHLSFFEARGQVLEYLRRLVKRNLVGVRTPGGTQDPRRRSRRGRKRAFLAERGG